MTAWITIVNGIIIAIAVQVQTVDGFGVQVGGVIRRDKSAPLGAVISSVAVVQAGVMVEVLAIVTNMGGFATAISAIHFTIFPVRSQEKTSQVR